MLKNKKNNLQFEEVVFDDIVYSESEYLEMPNSKNAFLIIIFLAGIVSLAILGRIGFLNLFFANFYEARASANVTREINLPSPRALIVDRFNEPIAGNSSSFSVFLDLSRVARFKSDIDLIIRDVSQILGLDEFSVRNAVLGADFEKSNWFLIARDVKQTEVMRLESLNNDAIQILGDYEREYTDAPIFSHIVGYTGIGRANSLEGKYGLEFQYNDELKGEDGKYIFYEDAFGKVLDGFIQKKPSPKDSFKTTIDAKLQRYFYNRLKDGLESLGSNSGVGLALNPKTGEILSLVSLPGFDSNLFVTQKAGDERSKILINNSKPLFNRVVSGMYSPGSAIKPLLVLSSLHEGVVDENTKIFSKGVLSIPNPYNSELPSNFYDWKPHGWVDSVGALARSSNIFFYLSGGGLPDSVPAYELVAGKFNQNGLGIKTLKNYWEKFGFGKPTGIDFPFESQGFLPDPEFKAERFNDVWRLGDTYNVSIGQGDFLVTPIQLLNFIASIANGGKIYRPFLKADLKPQIISDYSDFKEEIDLVKKGMRAAVKEPYGTAFSLSDLPMNVSGKTGTPQIANKTKINAIFVGFAPSEDPEIALLILVENAREGSLNTLPIAKDVFEWYYYNRIADTSGR